MPRCRGARAHPGATGPASHTATLPPSGRRQCTPRALAHCSRRAAWPGLARREQKVLLRCRSKLPVAVPAVAAVPKAGQGRQSRCLIDSHPRVISQPIALQRGPPRPPDSCRRKYGRTLRGRPAGRTHTATAAVFTPKIDGAAQRGGRSQLSKYEKVSSPVRVGLWSGLAKSSVVDVSKLLTLAIGFSHKVPVEYVIFLFMANDITRAREASLTPLDWGAHTALSIRI